MLNPHCADGGYKYSANSSSCEQFRDQKPRSTAAASATVVVVGYEVKLANFCRTKSLVSHEYYPVSAYFSRICHPHGLGKIIFRTSMTSGLTSAKTFQNPGENGRPVIFRTNLQDSALAKANKYMYTSTILSLRPQFVSLISPPLFQYSITAPKEISQ